MSSKKLQIKFIDLKQTNRAISEIRPNRLIITIILNSWTNKYIDNHTEF